MNLRKLGTVSLLAIITHIIFIILGYYIVSTTITTNSSNQPDIKPWNNLDANDPNKGTKIFTYVFSTYVGVNTTNISPNSLSAYYVTNVIIFFRFIFVLEVAASIYYLIIGLNPTTNMDVKAAVDRYTKQLFQSSMFSADKLEEPIFKNNLQKYISSPAAAAGG